MATYLILNIVFILAVCLVLKITPKRINKPMLLTCFVLLVLTAVFDNVIILADIVAYDPTKILGIKIFAAPIEDFMYAFLAVLLVPILWHTIGARDDK